MDDILIFNDDCFNIFPDIEDKSINLFILDLPYGQTACKWDSVINLEEMWKHIKRIMKPNAIIVFFCTAKFGYTLIHSNPKWFKYDLIYKKSKKVGFLNCNRAPLRQHENIYIFNNKPVTHSQNQNQEYSTYNPQKTEGTPYKVKGGKSKKVNGSLSRGHEVYSEEYENKGERHPSSVIEHENIYIFKDKGGTYNPQKTDGKPYKINRKGAAAVYNTKRTDGEYDGKRHPSSIIDHENIYIFKDKQGTYNPQKTEGKPYNKTNTGNNNEDESAYGKIDRSSHLEGDEHRKINKGERHPSSIIDHENIYIFKDKQGTYNPQKTERDKDYKHRGKRSSEEHYGNVLECKKIYKKEDGKHPSSIVPEYDGDTVLFYKSPQKTIHRTQKPVELLEWLIKTYSNEGDLVCDFTMGSGSCGVACMNTNRKFIGIEKDEEIFNLAFNRIEEHEKNLCK